MTPTYLLRLWLVPGLFFGFAFGSMLAAVWLVLRWLIEDVAMKGIK